MRAAICEHLTLPRLPRSFPKSDAVRKHSANTARMQRCHGSSRATHQNRSEDFRPPAKSAPGGDASWLGSAQILLTGGFLPSLAVCSSAGQVLSLHSVYRLGLLMSTDIAFACTAWCFLVAAERFAAQRLHDAPALPYPGPWKEASGERRLPQWFRPYLLALPLTVGTLLPLGTIATALLHGNDGLLVATCLAPYILTLLCQMWMESAFVKRGSYMWPMVPMVHMIYRLWQLGRGSALVAVMGGPGYLQYIQALLAIIWVFNFGAVMTWMPILYQWHLQPLPQEKASD